MTEQIVTEKCCVKCKEVKPTNAFRPDGRMRDGLRNACRHCDKKARDKWRKSPAGRLKVAAQARAWKDSPKGQAYYYQQEQKRQAARDAKKGGYAPYQPISLEEFQRRLAEQGGVCAVCKQAPNGKRLSLDHCHRTGKNRGLLCSHCNIGLGYLKDSTAVLESAIHYLLNYS